MTASPASGEAAHPPQFLTKWDRHVPRLKVQATIAQTLLWVNVAFWGNEALAAVGILSGADFSDSPWIDLVIVVETYYPVVLLISAIAFVVWSYNAHKGLALMKRSLIQHKDQATIWWWIVPVANLFMPFRVMAETAKGSEAPLDFHNWQTTSWPPIVGWWTGVLLVCTLLSRLIDPVDLSNGSWVLSLIASVGLAVAAALAAVMIGQISRNQALRGDEYRQREAQRARSVDIKAPGPDLRDSQAT